MKFHHASAEVVWEIARNLPSRDQKSLRLTCSQFNLATESLVLRYVVIDISAKPHGTTICQLRTLAEENPRVCEFARSLNIRSLRPTSPIEDAPRWLKYLLGMDDYGVETCMKKYLVKAISTLKRVESVAWTWNTDDPLWIAGPIMDAIASLPLMDDFQLGLKHPNTAFHLDHLSALRKLAVGGSLTPSILASLEQVIGKSPDLSHLAIVDSCTYYPSSSCMPFSKVPSATSLPLRHLVLRVPQLDLNPIRHIIGLHSFELECGFTLDDNVYLDLARGRVFCRRLLVHSVRATLFNHLSQPEYSGALQELSLLLLQEDALAGRFWETVLPNHAATLRVLNICSGLGGGWCLGDQAIHAVKQCTQLSSLTLTVDSHARLSGGHFEHDYEQSAFDMFVSSVIALSRDLPSLVHIHILIARTSLWHCYSLALAAFLDSFVDELVSNLTNHTCDIGVCGSLVELIQVESRVCRPQWGRCDGWRYRVVAPRSEWELLRLSWMGDERSRIGEAAQSGLEPRRVSWMYYERSRIGCDGWRDRVAVAPQSALEPVRVLWMEDERSRIGCDVCLGPL